MAEKKETKNTESKAKVAAEAIKQAEEMNGELSPSEKTAIEVIAGENAAGRKYKLSDPKKQYSEADFTLAGDQEKELPENPSDTLIARIRSGFIVEA